MAKELRVNVPDVVISGNKDSSRTRFNHESLMCAMIQCNNS